MSTIVHKPEPLPHVCRPGWTLRLITESAVGFPNGLRALDPPTPWDYPRGVVVECDCGATHVSLGAKYLNAPGMCYFRAEGKIERWRRERRQARA